MTSLLGRILIFSTALVLSGFLSAQEDVTRVVPLSKGAIVPDAEVDQRGVIHVAYLSDGNVFYVRSADEGTTFSKPIRVNTEPGFASGGGFRGPDIVIGKDDRVHVIWYNAGYQQKRPQSEWGVMYARFEKDAKRFEKARNLNQRPSDNFSLAADGTGRVAVIWMANGLFASLSTDGGQTFAAAANLKLDPCECCSSRALYTDDGDLWVLYRDKTDNVRDTNLAHLARGTSTWSNHRISETPWPIDSCPMTGSSLVDTQQGLAAAWETKSQPYFSVLEGVTRETKPREIRAAEKGRYPVVLTAKTGTTLVAWKNGKDLQWQIFNLKGTPVGQRKGFVSASPHRPAGVVARSGTFVLFP